MPKLKGMKTWRRPSLTWHRTEDEVNELTKAYRIWLAEKNNWYTSVKPCLRCSNGTVLPSSPSTGSTYTRWCRTRKKANLPLYYTEAERITCPHCDGKQFIELDEPVLDIAKVNEHIHASHLILMDKVKRAVEFAGEVLRENNYYPVLTTPKGMPNTLADYELAVQDYERTKQEWEASKVAWHKAYEDENAAYEAMTPEQQVEYLNSHEETETKRLEREHWDKQSQHMHFNYCDGVWINFTEQRIVYVNSYTPYGRSIGNEASKKLVFREGIAYSRDEVESILRSEHII